MELLEKVRDILLQPRQAWPELKQEATTIKGIYVYYAAVLAAIPSVAYLLGMTLVGISFLGTRYRAPFLGTLGYTVTSYILNLAALYVFALITGRLAPRFNSDGNFLNAIKLTVYSSTPYWISGVLLIIPTLSLVTVILSLYGYYLLYAGLPVLLSTPREKRSLYFIVLVAVSVIISILISFIASILFPQGRMGVV
ncbi:MAG: Inner membrane protein YohC [Syntrophorhabdaceae bacterium PtaU1.Bin034]|jgi:hypothetical protein|nr:MAG: Inner membrane protein YohC [Syntrophorhabdaceae bacterium PtaU1.Bin034]